MSKLGQQAATCKFASDYFSFFVMIHYYWVWYMNYAIIFIFPHEFSLMVTAYYKKSYHLVNSYTLCKVI